MDGGISIDKGLIKGSQKAKCPYCERIIAGNFAKQLTMVSCLNHRCKKPVAVIARKINGSKSYLPVRARVPTRGELNRFIAI